jgi:hypothetical protein
VLGAPGGPWQRGCFGITGAMSLVAPRGSLAARKPSRHYSCFHAAGLAAFKSLAKKAETMAIMPDAFDQLNKTPVTASLPGIPFASDCNNSEW